MPENRIEKSPNPIVGVRTSGTYEILFGGQTKILLANSIENMRGVVLESDLTAVNAIPFAGEK